VSERRIYRGIPVPVELTTLENAIWKRGVDDAKDYRAPDPECVTRYGPILAMEKRGDRQFHWHSEYHGHEKPEDPLMAREHGALR
jgi:hypothetical protein